MKRFIALTAAILVAETMLVGAGETKKDEVELKGKLGCAHCAFNKGNRCAVGFKTEDGKVYILDKPDKQVMDARMKGGEIKVVGTVAEKDGNLVVTASKTELLK